MASVTEAAKVRKSARKTAGEQLVLALYGLQDALKRLEEEHGAECGCDACYPRSFLARAFAVENMAGWLEGAGIEAVPETLQRNVREAEEQGNAVMTDFYRRQLAKATSR
jgi:hypothetical protein